MSVGDMYEKFEEFCGLVSERERQKMNVFVYGSILAIETGTIMFVRNMVAGFARWDFAQQQSYNRL